MNDAPTLTDAASLDGKAIADLAEQLNQLLRLRTFPIGMKLFEDARRNGECARPAPSAERPHVLDLPACDPGAHGRVHAGHHDENIPSFSYCCGVIGLDELGEIYTFGPQDGRRVVRESRGRLPRTRRGMSRVPAGRYHGWRCRRCAPRGSIRRTSACSTATPRR